LAIDKGYTELIKYLLTEHEIDDNIKVAALDAAIVKGNLEMVKVLVECGCDIHADDNVALKHAIYLGNVNIVKYFISCGFKNKIIKTILSNVEHVIMNGLDEFNENHIEIVNFLKSLQKN
jgi:hypothetical protein